MHTHELRQAVSYTSALGLLTSSQNRIESIGETKSNGLLHLSKKPSLSPASTLKHSFISNRNRNRPFAHSVQSMALSLSVILSPRQSTEDWLDWRTAVREHPNAEDPFSKENISTTARPTDFTISKELGNGDMNALQEIAPFEYCSAVVVSEEHDDKGAAKPSYGRRRLGRWAQWTRQHVGKLASWACPGSMYCCCCACFLEKPIHADPRHGYGSRSDLLGSASSRSYGASSVGTPPLFPYVKVSAVLSRIVTTQMVFPMEHLDIERSFSAMPPEKSRPKRSSREAGGELGRSRRQS